MAKTLHTEFAPAELMPIEIVRRQSEVFRSLPWAETLLNATSNYVVILNHARQVVFHSANVDSLVRGGRIDQCLGLRMGEMIGCEHLDQCGGGGCGTAEPCSQCGALHAVQEALGGRRSTQECRLLRAGRTGLEALDLLVTATPLDHNGERFCVCSFADISHQKRRQALERAFFHHLADSAGGVETLMQLLREEVPGNLRPDLQVAAGAVHELVEEVQLYRDLAAAERDEFTVRPGPADAGLLVTSVVAEQRRSGQAEGIHIQFTPPHEPLGFTTDLLLLRRVLTSLLQNALEATPAGSKITLGCERVGDRVRFWVHNPAGMAREVQLQVFNRSFTTKGEGRGLGTYSARLFTEKYLAGKVDFHTSPVEGTTFLVEVPRNGPVRPPAAG